MATLRTRKPLTQADVDFYNEHGFLHVRGFIDPALVEQVRAEVSGLHEKLAAIPQTGEYYGITWEDLPESEPKRIRQLMGSQNVSATLRAISESEQLIGAMEQLIGAEAELFHSKLMMKAANKGSFTPWHSDWGYWKGTFTRPTQMNAFLAIDASTIENGCIRYVPGSHREFQEHQFFSDASGFAIGLPGDIDAYDAVPIEMQPGDVTFHGSITIHGSEANSSHQDRIMNTFAFAEKGTVCDTDDARRSFYGQLKQRDDLFEAK